MARYIKSYSDRDDVVIEVAVTALSEKGAKARGSISVFGRRPGQLTGVEDIDVFLPRDDGIVNEYRVAIKISPNESLRNKAKIDKVAQFIEELL